MQNLIIEKDLTWDGNKSIIDVELIDTNLNTVLMKKRCETLLSYHNFLDKVMEKYNVEYEDLMPKIKTKEKV